jgi:uncharacterized protein DUF6174
MTGWTRSSRAHRGTRSTRPTDRLWQEPTHPSSRPTHVSPCLRTSLVAVAAGCALLTGCATDSGDAAASATASFQAAQPATQAASPTATLPESYRYVLTSSCGERGLLGDYKVMVRDGRVTSVANLNEDYPYDPEPSEIPTLADLLDMARSASPEAVVELTLDGAGLPQSLSLDPVPNGIDDEECYEVSDLEIIRGGAREHQSGGSARPGAGGDGEERRGLGARLMGVHTQRLRDVPRQGDLPPRTGGAG